MKRFPLVLLVALMTLVSAAPAQKSQPQINEIVLEGVQGGDIDHDTYGPGFKITVRRDGSALFTGKAKVKLIGEFEGTISSAEFEHLVSFMVGRNYQRIHEDPINSSQITPAAGSARFIFGYAGSPYMITTVGYEGGETKTIYRPTTARGIDLKHIPKELFEIEQAVFDTATRIRWAKIK
jgi:hypothetical protein